MMFNLKDAIIQHLELSLFALVISIVFGMLIGVLLYKKKFAEKIIAFFSAIQTIPTLAMLGFLVPLIGIGFLPAIIVLIIYGIYPIILNTYSGISQVDPEYLEISDALGMNEKQKLFKVKLPLATPIIMTGIRNGMVQIVGIATLTSLIGAGGLGDFIYRGINAMDNELILKGAIPTVIIVIVLNSILKYFEINWQKLLRFKKHIIIIIIIICIIITGLFLMPKNNKKVITLASKDFTESGILTTIMAELIEEKTDIEVEKKMYIGTTDILHKALVKGEIDGYVEYSGTAYLTVFNQTDPNIEILPYVINEYDKLGIKAFDSLGINNTFVVLQSKNFEKKYGLNTISDLQKYNNQLILTAYAEFIEREDGLNTLLDQYNLKFKDVRQLERSMGYRALSQNEVDLMISFSTEPAIFRYQFKALEDDKNIFLKYDAIPLLREDVITKYPELEEVISSLEHKFNNETMSKLNHEVENEKKSEIDVARNWLKEEGLIE